jgi:hypothetical protein
MAAVAPEAIITKVRQSDGQMGLQINIPANHPDLHATLHATHGLDNQSSQNGASGQSAYVRRPPRVGRGGRTSAPPSEPDMHLEPRRSLRRPSARERFESNADWDWDEFESDKFRDGPDSHNGRRSSHKAKFWTSHRCNILMTVLVTASSIAILAAIRVMYLKRKAARKANQEQQQQQQPTNATPSRAQQVVASGNSATAPDYVLPVTTDSAMVNNHAVVNPGALSSLGIDPNATIVTTPAMMTTVYQPMLLATADTIQTQPIQSAQARQGVVHKAFQQQPQSQNCANGACDIPRLLPGSSITPIASAYRRARQ